MTFELREGQGTLFRVAEKQNERGPDYEGQLNIDGKMFRVAGWIKLGRKGKWLSLSVEVPKPRAALESKPQDASQPAQIDPDGDIPF